MLPTESLQDAFVFLSRDNLDAMQLVSSLLHSVVANLPADSPIRHIAWLYLKKDDHSQESVQLELVLDERDIGEEKLVAECADISRFVRNASISNLSFRTLVGILIERRSHFSCSTCD